MNTIHEHCSSQKFSIFLKLNNKIKFKKKNQKSNKMIQNFRKIKFSKNELFVDKKKKEVLRVN